MEKAQPEDKEYLRALLLACVGEIEINENKWLIPFEDRIDPKYFHYRVKNAENGGSKKAFNNRCIENLETLFSYLFKLKKGGGGFTERRAIAGCNNAIAVLTERFGADFADFANDERLSSAENARRREGLYKILCESFASYACGATISKVDAIAWATKYGVGPSRVPGNSNTGASGAAAEISAYGPELLGVLLFDGSEDFAFDYASEQKVWKRLSNMVSSGMPIDQGLAEGLKRGSFQLWGPDADAFMNYFMAKLCLKRGNVSSSLEYMANANAIAGRISEDNSKRLALLTGMRAETVKPVHQWSSDLDFMRSLDKLQGLRVPDRYIAYESASVIGVEAAACYSFMLANNEYSRNLTPFVNRLTTEHDALLSRHPHALRNQEVVNLSLHWFNSIFSYRQTFDECRLTDILDAANKGFALSKKRLNNLFYMQSVIVLAIYLYACGEIASARYAISVYRYLANAYGITEHQEGFGALLDSLRAIARRECGQGEGDASSNRSKRDDKDVGRLFCDKQPYDCDIVTILGL